MPAVFAHPWPADLAETHFNLVGDDGRKNQILAAQPFTLAKRERRGDQIARMTRIGLPIDVVVIHRADHVTVDKRRIDRISLEPGDESGRRAVAAAHRPVMFQQYLGVILLTATERAADGVEPE